jgi:hypothetical protein
METYNQENRFVPKTSIIRIPVNLDLAELEKSLNAYLNSSLYEDDSFDDGDRMKVKATKDGVIRISVEEMAISYQVPLSLWVQYNTGIGKVEATGRLNLDFKTSFAIGKDWKMLTQTFLQNHEWKEKPRIRLGGVSIPVESIANLILQRSTATIGKNIDETLAKSFKLEEYVASAWQLMFHPVELSSEYQTWLLANPTDLGMTPIRVENGKMLSTIVVQSQPSLRFGPRPASNPQFKLPDFSFRNLNPSAEKGFQIYLDATLAYADAERLTKQSIQGQRFEQGKRYVVVEDVELFGQGNNIVVNLKLSGSYNGNIYLTGEPVFNPNRNRIEVEDLEYTLDSKNVLLRSAAWLAKGTLKQKLQENMDYLLDYNLQDAQRQMRETLQGYEIAPGIQLQGDLEELDIHNAYLSADGIRVVMLLSGNLGINVAGLANFGR